MLKGYLLELLIQASIFSHVTISLPSILHNCQLVDQLIEIEFFHRQMSRCGRHPCAEHFVTGARRCRPF